MSLTSFACKSYRPDRVTLDPFCDNGSYNDDLRSPTSRGSRERVSSLSPQQGGELRVVASLCHDRLSPHYCHQGQYLAGLYRSRHQLSAGVISAASSERLIVSAGSDSVTPGSDLAVQRQSVDRWVRAGSQKFSGLERAVSSSVG